MTDAQAAYYRRGSGWAHGPSKCRKCGRGTTEADYFACDLRDKVYQCKVCRKAKHEKWLDTAQNRDLVNARRKDVLASLRESDPKKHQERLDRQKRWYDENWSSRIIKRLRQKKYGLAPEQYDEMVRRQGGVCLICQTAHPTEPLAVDHCHASGKVRGLLCRKCNTAIALLREDPDSIARAMEYVRKHKESNAT